MPFRPQDIALIVLDFDGVLTDNRVMVDQDGREAVICSRADGWGVSILQNAGFPLLCISTEENPVVSARCRKMGIEYLQGQKDKRTALSEYLQQHKIAPERVMYVGNDSNDLECMQWVGFPVAVADAIDEVKAVAIYITKTSGGHGVIRELASCLVGKEGEK